VILRPANTILPLIGRSMPATARMSEDLPAPLAPTSATISPFSIASETPACAAAPP